MSLPKSIAESDLMSTSDVARAMKVHRSTVWGWLKSGMLKGTRKGSFWCVRPKELERFRKVYQ